MIVRKSTRFCHGAFEGQTIEDTFHIRLISVQMDLYGVTKSISLRKGHETDDIEYTVSPNLTGQVYIWLMIKPSTGVLFDN